MESLNLQVVAVLMPLEIECYTVPYLKALTRSIESRRGHGRAVLLAVLNCYEKCDFTS